MTKREHLLTLVEPTKGGDATLDLAHSTVERGGDATVVMLITDRVRRDISDYATSENLDRAEAEGRAMDQLDRYCRSRVGGDTTVVASYRWPHTDVAKLVTPGITAIAVPERLVSKRSVRKLVKRTGLPVVVAPSGSDRTPDVAA